MFPLTIELPPACPSAPTVRLTVVTVYMETRLYGHCSPPGSGQFAEWNNGRRKLLFCSSAEKEILQMRAFVHSVVLSPSLY